MLACHNAYVIVDKYAVLKIIEQHLCLNFKSSYYISHQFQKA